MRHILFKVLTVTGIIWFVSVSAMAAGMNHDGRMGEKIHETMKEGYHLAYHVMALPQKNTTHHLMLYINDKKGDDVSSAMVGFLITGPDGSRQKKMAMGMKGAFGANVRLDKKGTYTITTKVLVESTKIIDTITLDM